MMKKTRQALLTSILALLLCCSMLVGTTFAWFTDEVVSTGNKIQAGNLKIDLELLDETTKEWSSIKESKDPLFTYDNWEPGYTDVTILKVENEGSLALKWVAQFVSAGELSKLADVIDVYVNPSATEIAYPEERTVLDGWQKVGNLTKFINTLSETTYGNLKAEEEAYLGIALHMQETAGNEYQGLVLGDFDIKIFATQYTYEEDSFDDQYDADAPVLIMNADELMACFANGGAGKLGANIEIDANRLVVDAGTKVKLDLNGYNITALADIAADENEDQILARIEAGASLAISGNGNITMTTTGTDIGPDYMTCMFLVQGGDLTISEGVVVDNVSGVLSNGFAVVGNADPADGSSINLKGATLASYDRPLRIRSSNSAVVTVNADNCTITSRSDGSNGYDPYAVWMECTEHENCTSNKNRIYMNNCTVTGVVQDDCAKAGHFISIYEDGDIHTEMPDTITVHNNEELAAALVKANNGKTIVLATGEYTIPQLKNTVKDITVIGTDFAKVNGVTVYKTNVLFNFTFKDVTFTADVKAVFYGNCVFDNCDFIATGITRQSKINTNATLTVKNCRFVDGMDAGALWFQGTVSTVNVENCEFINTSIVFGKTMNVTFDECSFKEGTEIRGYGSLTVTNGTFEPTCVVGASISAAEDITITLTDCAVTNGADVKSVCYNFGDNLNGYSATFVIDGITYDRSDMHMRPNI